MKCACLYKACSHWAVQGEEGNWATQCFGTIGTSTRRKDRFLSSLESPGIVQASKMVGYGPSIEFAVQEKSSSSLMSMWAIICKFLQGHAEHMQGMDILLAFSVLEFG